MSGLFHRLASQVVGPVPARVHAPAPQRYQSAGIGDEHTTIPAEFRDEPSIIEKTTPGAPAFGLVPDQESGPGIGDAENIAGRRGPAELSTPQIRIPNATEAGPRLHGSFPSNTQPEQTSANEFIDRSSESQSASDRPPTSDGARPVRESPSARARLLDALPEPLLPRVDARVISARVQTPATTVEHSPGRSGIADPNEVHVHIGRIEVTATTESAPTKRTARRGKGPLSLHDYLVRRERERT